ncbi:hypothetical protein CANINC_000742 [Pichia inconspicua]|uniref:Phosphatidic acid phosphatase type 2/haloperoxidase domain-containing protein n=1 Tax=Pichia inconspicua TaxID=52247 RepID=A0A4T0X5S0_9ASCO|nr:hypothetical protein CANINC_000742 [[Candida] inconspicua]
MGNITLIPFDHTYILYSPEKSFSLPLAASSLFPILILVFLFSWHIVTREIEPCIFAAGHVCNDIISGILKNLVKYPRPIRGQIFKKDGGLVWGMPSSHSQFMSFWITYTFLSYIQNYPKNSLSRLEKIIFTTMGMAMVMLVVASRIVFEYHNWYQVIVGLILGNTLASAYYIFVCILREYGIINVLLNNRIMRLWNMKDSFGAGTFATLKEERQKWEHDTLGNSKL